MDKKNERPTERWSIPVQFIVCDALKALRFDERMETKPGDSSEFDVTEATIKYLQKLLNDKKRIFVDADGKVAPM